MMTDTENVRHDAVLTFPFASHILTPSCFWKDLGKKHIRYSSYNELAYLHENYFTPDETILEQMDVRKGERFVVMRFVSRSAVHDIGQEALNIDTKRRAVMRLSKYARIFISSD